MASVPTVPNDSSNRVLQDRFNQDLVALVKQLQDKVVELEERIVVLEP